MENNGQGAGYSTGYDYQPMGNGSAPNNDTNVNYQYDSYNQPKGDMTPLSLGGWILTILIPFVPCVGIIMYIYWAISSTGNIGRRNYCRAYFVVVLIAFIISIIFYVVMFFAFGASMAALTQTMESSYYY